MSKYRRAAAVLMIMVMVVVALSPVAQAEEPKKPVYYVITHGGPADPFWGVVVKGVDDAGKELNVDARYAAPAGVFSIQDMVNILNTAISSKPDGIAVSITNVEALDKPIRSAIDQGIPVIAVNTPDIRPEAERIPYMFYIGAYGYDGGFASGQQMLAVRTPKRAVCATHEAGHADHIARCQGFKDALKGVTVDDLDIGQDPTQAVEILKAYFTKNPDADALLTLGPPGEIPAHKWLKESDNVGKIMFGTFDLGTDALDAIRDGSLMFAVDQQQYYQGYLSITYLDLYHRHLLKPPQDIKTGPFFVSKDNVEGIAKQIEAGYR